MFAIIFIFHCDIIRFADMNIIIVRPPAEVRIGQLHDVVILLQLPESSVCCFLVQIKPIVLLTSVELTNLNNKAKTK